ncbi:MAG: HAMP domain-containing protein [Planctomycetes bacterium]|nr:HAMP domain-containing protein [Planctomycetota bacterium]
MSLRSKIVILLSAVVLAYAGLDHLMQRVVVYDKFVELERTMAQKEVTRVSDAIQREVTLLTRDCLGLADAEKLKAAFFVRAKAEIQLQDELALLPRDTLGLAAAEKLKAAFFDRTKAEFEAALPPSQLAQNSVQLVCVCDAKGNILYSRVRDWVRDSEISLQGFRLGENLVREALISDESNPLVLQGVVDTNRSILMASSCPIIERLPDGSGRTLGALVIGRFLNSMVDMLAARTSVPFEAWSTSSDALPDDARTHLNAASDPENPLLVEIDDDRLSAYWTVHDVRHKPTLMMRADFERPITAKGSAAVRYALVSTIAAGLLLMLVLLNLVQRTVLEPLGQLTAYAVNIGNSDEFTKRIRSDRQDEVGILAREFDGMIERVAESRAALVETARAAGMSEIATGVLHNVGNVLNSVNVSARIAAEKARGTSTTDLKMVMETLRPTAKDLGAFIQNDPRGKHLFPLLDSLADRIADERMVMIQELEALSEGIDHIKELVQSQQGYAGRAGVREAVSLASQIESAISITSQAASATTAVQVIREFDDIEPIPVDRHRLMEILVNLIQNARQSVLEFGSMPARVTVRIKKLPLNRVRIDVTDNGVGIAPENLARVFTHGFTTKKNGHGFGLHASANAATEMGGSLSAHSEGKGLGATFSLELPLPVLVAAGATS